MPYFCAPGFEAIYDSPCIECTPELDLFIPLGCSDLQIPSVFSTLEACVASGCGGAVPPGEEPEPEPGGQDHWECNFMGGGCVLSPTGTYGSQESCELDCPGDEEEGGGGGGTITKPLRYIWTDDCCCSKSVCRGDEGGGGGGGSNCTPSCAEDKDMWGDVMCNCTYDGEAIGFSLEWTFATCKDQWLNDFGAQYGCSSSSSDGDLFAGDCWRCGEAFIFVGQGPETEMVWWGLPAGHPAHQMGMDATSGFPIVSAPNEQWPMGMNYQNAGMELYSSLAQCQNAMSVASPSAPECGPLY